MTGSSRLASLQLVPMPGSAGLGACRTPDPETAAGRRDGDSAFHSSDSERSKYLRKKSGVAVTDKDLQLSTYIWDSTASTVGSGKDNGGSF